MMWVEHGGVNGWCMVSLPINLSFSAEMVINSNNNNNNNDKYH